MSPEFTGYGNPSPRSGGGRGHRISPNTNKRMVVKVIRGKDKEGKDVNVEIDVDEQGGVFLDPDELGQLANISQVEVLLEQKIKEVTG